VLSSLDVEMYRLLPVKDMQACNEVEGFCFHQHDVERWTYLIAYIVSVCVLLMR
jgi:hypothetical protein